MPTRDLFAANVRSLAAAALALFASAGVSLAAPKTGACCLPSGACVIVTSSNCSSQGGSYRGNNSTCAAPCPLPTGGCCLSTGACSVLTQNQCTAQRGTYRGNGTNCSTPCPAPVAACCSSTGACSVLTQAQCTAAGGSWFATWTSCSPSPCPVPIAAHGVLVASTRDFICVRFEDDRGFSYILSTQGTAQPGDRIYVEGSVPQNTAGTCENYLVAQINVTVIRPAFAGIGTLVNLSGQTLLQTDDGRLYALQNTGGFALGSRVFTRGWVDTAQDPPRISANDIGAPFAAFGRLMGPPATDKRLLADNGQIYTLDGIGAFDAVATDYMYVEGIAGPNNTVTRAGARRAFSTSGLVIDNGAGGKALLADNIIFNDTFAVAGLAPYALGSKVFVRGQAPGDYDYGEPRADQIVRQPTVAAAGFAFGVLNLATRTVTDLDTGTVFVLENTAGFPDQEFVYVAGAIGAVGAGTITLSHNLTLIGLELQGNLYAGFECTPLFSPGSGTYFLENNGGFPVGTNVTVRGGIDRRAAPCDFDSFVNNSIILGAPER